MFLLFCDKRNIKRSKGNLFDGFPFAIPSANDQERGTAVPLFGSAPERLTAQLSY